MSVRNFVYSKDLERSCGQHCLPVDMAEANLADWTELDWTGLDILLPYNSYWTGLDILLLTTASGLDWIFYYLNQQKIYIYIYKYI